MSIRKIIANIPVIGYIARWFSGIAFLPRHLSRFHHGIDRDAKKIAGLEAGLLRANRQIIELEEKLDNLRLQSK